MSNAQLTELKSLLSEADRRGDRVNAEKLILKIESIKQHPQPEQQLSGRAGRAQRLRQESEAEREQVLSQLPPERRELIESVSPTEQVLIGVGRGLTDIARGLGLADPEPPEVTESLAQLEQAQPSAIPSRAVGQALPFIAVGGPTAAITQLGPRALAVAGIGALEGGIIARGTGQDIEDQLGKAGTGAVIAGGLEIGLPIIGKFARKAFENATGTTTYKPLVTPDGNPTPELQDALNQSGQNFDDLLRQAREEVELQTDDVLTSGDPLSRSVDKAFRQAAPTIDQLKAQSRSIYQKIDSLGAGIKPQSIQNFVSDLSKKVNEAGYDKTLHPKVKAVLDRFTEEGTEITDLSSIDRLRRIAGNPAGSIDKDEARIGSIIVDEFDSYLDKLGTKDFVGDSFKGIGKEFKEARRLWGKARRSELILEAVDKAKNQASGLENGLRIQFRSILNNKKKRKFFNPDEISSMEKVIQGGPLENTAKFLGKFGFTEGQATSMLGSFLGVAGGAQVGGPVGAVVVPAVGQVSKQLAQRLTKRNAQLADLVVRAGTDGKKITQAYLSKVPKSQQNSAELTQLLMRPDISLKAIESDLRKRSGSAFKNRQVVKDAIYMLNTLSKDQLKNIFGFTAVAAAANEGEQ